MGFGKDGKGAILKEQVTFALAGLAGQDLVQADSAISLDGDFRILKTDLTCVITGLTAGEGNGLILYMAQGELSAAEQEANIETNGPVSSQDRTNAELAERWVRRLAILSGNTATNTERVMRNENNGGLLKFQPRWTFKRRRTASSGGWNWSIYNDGVTITTGATARILATHYGVWVG